MINPDFNAIIEQMLATHDKKNSDYAEQDNPYSNFEGAAKLAGITVEQGFLYILGIKLERLRQLVGTGREPLNEPIDDSILDAAVYAVIWQAYRRQAKRNAESAAVAEALAQQHPTYGTVQAADDLTRAYNPAFGPEYAARLDQGRQSPPTIARDATLWDADGL